MTTNTWNDLGPRALWGGLLAGAGAAMVYFGGFVLMTGLLAIGTIGIWELHRMLGGTAPLRAAGFTALGLVAAMMAQIVAFGFGDGFLENLLFSPWVIPFLGLALLGAVQNVPEDHRWVFTTYGALFLFAVIGLLYLRIMYGIIFMAFVVAVVVASDIAGYFAGRILGGPKFWPRVSPKKTWSGTIAGWIAAALVSWAILGFEPVMVLIIAPVLAFAAQMGDIIESAIKRRVEAKDSSDLIPGHGGILDRFDAMAGAGAVATLAMIFGGHFLQ